jgi:hypothetical protein
MRNNLFTAPDYHHHTNQYATNREIKRSRSGPIRPQKHLTENARCFFTCVEHFPMGLTGGSGNEINKRALARNVRQSPVISDSFPV